MSWDYIIVGAGSAGCVLAARLSEDANVKVLLLEAGPKDTNPWIHIPLGYGKLFNHKRLNWLFKSQPEPHLDGRVINQPRGKVLGGSSSINGLLYVRGQAADFEGWARAAGNRGWDYEDMLGWFRKAEDQQHGADTWHGEGGPLAVSDPSEPHPLCDAWIAAGQQAGYPLNSDFNGERQEGVGYYQSTMRKGRRCSAAVAYLTPEVRRRANLSIVTGAMVRRVLFEGRRAVGVEYDAKGARQSARSDGEVILAAGAIGTPQLLELSGVGGAERLAKLGVGLVHDNPEVGENFQDHLQVRFVYKAARAITFNDDMRNPLRMAGVGLKYALSRKGPLTVSAGYAGGFFRSAIAADERPDIQCLFITFSTTKMGDQLHPFSGFTVSACPLRPTSRGYVHATSRDPCAAPAIQANFLASEKDCNDVVAGMKIIRDIMAQSAITDEYREELIPGRAITDDAALLAYARETAGSIYHASCTAALGKVVDGSLKVMGVEGLRVADASIMPSVVSGNTNAAVIAIGEKSADMIRTDRKG
ncbi:GMC family oxidoreductase [Novosphingobium malaysiense]|uniref:Choline dehydrogenase n=1 Tax=Novosphingobium malaysiense TaxID=1348853 RepID=A0A0B1ZII7_9SPHN|nr:choline dehydrogenase [Novosphingobium malaysiense]KHK89117.1 choline dehydrogenase [Novosphingobium malaysiense]